MNTVPIVVPVQTTREVQCIIQAGKKYCETSDATPRDLGIVLLVFGGIFAYLLFVLWLGLAVLDNIAVALLGLLAPLFIFGLILLFL